MPVTKKLKPMFKKGIAVFMLFTLLNQIFAPTIAYALTAGPTAPEATNFEPVDTTDMVNPLTGGLTYNIPLLEVPGPEGSYPLALSYHAGIQPNEEASWVGLGWSLNPGAISRNVNGYPDDWSGAAGLTRSVWNGGSTETITGGVGIGYGPTTVNIGLSFSQDTYRGFGMGLNLEAGEGFSLGGGLHSGISANIGVGPYGGTYAGIGYSVGGSTAAGLGISAGASIQASSNSISATLHGGISAGKTNTSLLGASISTSNIKPSFSVGGGEITSAYNPSANNVSTSSSGFSLSIPIGVVSVSLGYNYTRYWSNNPNPFVANGLLYNRATISGSDINSTDLNNSDDDNYELFDPVNTNMVDNPNPLFQLGGTYPDFDNYSVAAQGLGGNIRPYIFSSVLYTENYSSYPNASSGIELSTNGVTRNQWQFRFINDFSNSYQQGHPWTADQSDTPQSYDFDTNPQYGNNDGDYGYDASTNRLEGSNHIEYFTNDQIASGVAASRGFIDCDAAGFTRGTTANPGTINQTVSTTIGKQIGGFMITNASGVTYHYALPAYSSDETQRTENFLTANISNTSSTVNWQYTDLTKNEAYAYTWYLTAITGPDYVSRGSVFGKLSPNDWGYWIKFDYGKWADTYRWRNPSEGENDDPASPGNTIYSMGRKELYYLDAIETRTHTAIFEKEIRADGKGMAEHDENTAYQPNTLYYPYILSSGVYQHPTATLRLNNIYLFQNDQLPMSINAIRQNSTTYDHSFNYNGTVENVHYGQNVIDKNDITQALVNNCLRKIAFTYDYSLCPGCPNSYDPGGLNTYVQNPSTSVPASLLGKLTLLSVDFQGRGGALMTPPTGFQYDLDPTDPNNQDTFTVAIGQTKSSTSLRISPALIQFGTHKFKPGDIVALQGYGTNYYCTILATESSDNAYYCVFLNNNGLPTNASGTALRTKNPPYNKDAYDEWGFYKSDYGTGLNQVTASMIGKGYLALGNNYPITKQRRASRISNNATDVWSLRKIISSIGANINIAYEGNTYNKSVLSQSQAVSIDGYVGSQVSPHNYSFPVNAMGVNLNDDYKIGDVLHMIFIAYNGQNYPSCIFGNTDSYATPATITGIDATNSIITIQVDPAMETAYLSSGLYSLYANLKVNGSVFYGGGIRAKDIIVDDLNGNVKKTSYNYQMPGSSPNQLNSSGVTAYEPTLFDLNSITDLYWNSITYSLAHQDPTPVINTYRKALYANNSKILSIAQEAPSPGIMYEYVTMADTSILSNGNKIPINGSTLYQYEVFKPEMIGIYDYNNEGTISASYPVPNDPLLVTGTGDNGQPTYSNTEFIYSQAKKDRSIKDYTSRIGNLKRMITYDNLGNKLTEIINHYLYDNLENTSFLNQVNNYEPLLAAYNNIGVIKERYGNARILTNSQPTSNESMVMLSNKETFPSIQTGKTQIDYKNGTRVDQTNLAFDFYTGAVTKTLTTDSYGNRFISQATPAYIEYPALGLKTHDDDLNAVQHKQMLTQQAANYTFSVDVNNNPIGVVSASVQTWSNLIPVLDPNGNTISVATTPNPTISNTQGQSGIWRESANYSWLPGGTAANNITPYASFADYYAANGSSNPAWKKTSQITQYNVYSAALEATDINNNYAATRMGYNNSKVLVSGTAARYNEIAYAGAEDALLTTGNFSNNISPGAGTIVSDSTKSHTGLNSLMVASGQQGFTYSVPISQLSPVAKNYSVAVWVYSPSANVNQTSLYYTVNGSTLTSTQTYSKAARGWYLLEMTVPANVISGTGNLVVGCTNNSSGTVYFDDFRFQPTSASATAYVYDNSTGELTYVINNNNLFTRYQYDAIGRLVRVYKEVLGKSNTPLIKGITYNYGRGI